LADKLATGNAPVNGVRPTNLYVSITNAVVTFTTSSRSASFEEFDYIAVGNVNAPDSQDPAWRSCSHAGWSAFRGMLRYKATRTAWLRGSQ